MERIGAMLQNGDAPKSGQLPSRQWPPRPHHPATRPEDGKLGEGGRGPKATSHCPCGTQRPADHAHQRPEPPRLRTCARSRRVGDPDRLPQGQAGGGEWAPRPTRPMRRQAGPSWAHPCPPQVRNKPRPLALGLSSARARRPHGARGTTPGHPRNTRRQPAGVYAAGPVPDSETNISNTHNTGHNTNHYRHRNSTEDPYLIPGLRHSHTAMAEPTAPRNTRRRCQTLDAAHEIITELRLQSRSGHPH